MAPIQRLNQEIVLLFEFEVAIDLVHPCFYVDEIVYEYCVNEHTCWTLEQCAAAFPDDFSNSEVSELDQIIYSLREFKEAGKETLDSRAHR